jgi:hypothetical protein
MKRRGSTSGEEEDSPEQVRDPFSTAWTARHADAAAKRLKIGVEKERGNHLRCRAFVKCR